MHLVTSISHDRTMKIEYYVHKFKRGFLKSQFQAMKGSENRISDWQFLRRIDPLGRVELQLCE